MTHQKQDEREKQAPQEKNNLSIEYNWTKQAAAAFKGSWPVRIDRTKNANAEPQASQELRAGWPKKERNSSVARDSSKQIAAPESEFEFYR